MKRSTSGLLFAAGSTLAAAAIGSVGSRRSPQVYRQLRKPDWAPPAGVFGPVWSALYAAIGVAGWRLWTRRAGRVAVGLHAGQLALNASWPLAFFVVREKKLSLAVVAALDAAIAAEIAAVAPRDRAAAGLLAPYLAWSLYATALTAAVSDPGAES